MRLAVDTGGTFTDLVVEDDEGELHALQERRRHRTILSRGVLDVDRCRGRRLSARREPSRPGRVFIHGTTRAINAILTGATARTAFLTTPGASATCCCSARAAAPTRSISRAPYPAALRPARAHLRGAGADRRAGEVVKPLDEDAVVAICARLRPAEVEAVGVCLLWSIANPAHELRVGELLARASARASRSRSRIGSTRRSASTAARRPRASTRR